MVLFLYFTVTLIKRSSQSSIFERTASNLGIDCYETKENYLGNISEMGCMQWNAWSLIEFGDNSHGDHSYCRKSKYDKKPWCQVSRWDGSIEKMICESIPDCSSTLPKLSSLSLVPISKKENHFIPRHIENDYFELKQREELTTRNSGYGKARKDVDMGAHNLHLAYISPECTELNLEVITRVIFH